MRIMHLSRAAETLRWHLVPTMKYQQMIGHYVCICTSEEVDPCVTTSSLTDAQILRNEGFDVFTHAMKRNLNPFSMLRALILIYNVLRSQRIDVVICHSALGALVGRAAAVWARTRCIIYFAHGLPFVSSDGVLSWGMKFLVEKIMGYFTDAIILMNTYDYMTCIRTRLVGNPQKIFRIPGIGVDLDRFDCHADPEARNAVFSELRFAPTWKMIITVGRMIPEKGSAVFVEAAISLSKIRDDLCFVVVGYGPLYTALDTQIQENFLGSRITLLGWVDDVTRYVRAADIFTLPSYYNEGLPVSILEAMSCGKPCIVTRQRGCEDAVEDGQSGILIPIKDSRALVDAILRLVDDEQRMGRMGRAARKRAEDVFERAACTKRIVECLEQAMR